MAFCGEFVRNSSWEAGVLEVSPAGGSWYFEKITKSYLIHPIVDGFQK
jgi:hypothetical protein